MSNKSKMNLFMSVVAVVTVLALAQGIMAEGSGKTLPLILGGLGAVSLAMWAMALHSTKSR
ncbi:hypothetical protein [Streptomyces flavidovirens]|uniref:hypothetical protein n=1 Tax=Streptomyces flavidovirens TaxID=67298 RepID=UPI000421A2EC|nr:hypothetical protein [Streptomyces flavidovirens]